MKDARAKAQNGKGGDRQGRLASALRANLKRRKAQARRRREDAATGTAGTRVPNDEGSK
jgi:hypothetical protein